MTDRNNDDVARALEALSSGEHQEPTDHDAADHIESPAAAPVRPAQRPKSSSAASASPKPTQQSSSANRNSTSRPAAPQPSRPAAPASAAPTPKPAARPVAPAPAGKATPRPAAPSASPIARPAAPTAGQRPAAPTQRAASQQAVPQAEPQIVDDDAVIVPAPDASVFFHKPDYAAKPKRQAFGQSIRFRQTFIPILLTGGFIMIVLALLHFAWTGESNPLSELPTWLLAVLVLFGLILWALAAANMMSVKSALAAQRKA